MSLYPPNLTLREARDQHFARNGFSEAQYTARFARFRLGRFSLWLPNTRGRARALPCHDLHHVLTEYPTTWRGEAEMAAWELASGCGRHLTVWLINLSAALLGLVLAPAAGLPRVPARPARPQPLRPADRRTARPERRRRPPAAQSRSR
jgi:hypothetical protein